MDAVEPFGRPGPPSRPDLATAGGNPVAGSGSVPSPWAETGPRDWPGGSPVLTGDAARVCQSWLRGKGSIAGNGSAFGPDPAGVLR